MRPLFEASFLTPHDSQLATAVARSVRPLPCIVGELEPLELPAYFNNSFLLKFLEKLM